MKNAQDMAERLHKTTFSSDPLTFMEAATLLRTQDALLRQALEALEWSLPKDGAAITYEEAINAIKEHLK